MSAPLHHPTEHALLGAFLDSGRSETAFCELVASVGGLIHGSALRRTGQPQMAEDVTQNVLAILARKAATLRQHPSLIAWIFQTTRYEASKAMRGEKRRLRKHLALAQQSMNIDSTAYPEEPENWKEALPLLDACLDDLPALDRELILERYYGQRPYAEIASRLGSTEAACKMRVKRALEKLSNLLRGRKVGLSVSALTVSLTAALAPPASAATAAALSATALSAASAVGTTSLFSNIVSHLSIMAKSHIIATTSVIIVASLGTWGLKENARLRAELAQTAATLKALESKVALPAAKPEVPMSKDAELLSAASGGTVNAKSFLPGNAESLAKALESPAVQAQMNAAIHTTVASRYRDICDELQLDEAERSKLFQLVADRINPMKDLTTLLAAKDKAEGKKIAKQMKESEQAIKKEIAVLLGPEKAVIFDRYEDSQQEREQIAKLKSDLSGVEHALTGDQEDKLMNLLHKKRKAKPVDSDASGGEKLSKAEKAAKDLQEDIKWTTKMDAEVMEEGRQFLSQPQLEALQREQENRRQTEAMRNKMLFNF